MKRKIAVVTGVLVGYGALLVFLAIWLSPSRTAATRRDSEHQLYAAVVRPPAVLAENTYFNSYDFSAQSLVQVKANLPAIEDETIADFVLENDRSYPLLDYFPKELAKCTFLNDVDIKQLFGADWSAFELKYPLAYAITSLSRIGFNSSYTQALVFRTHQSGESLSLDQGSYSEGTFLLLKRATGVWVLVGDSTAWIS